METTNTVKITCPFCGKERYITIYTDDGTDWCGHARGKYRTWKEDQGCSCFLGAIVHDKAEVIKPMCLNCKYYNDINCINKTNMANISTLFEIPELVVKDNTNKCNNWELNADLVAEAITGGEEDFEFGE